VRVQSTLLLRLLLLLSLRRSLLDVEGG